MMTGMNSNNTSFTHITSGSECCSTLESAPVRQTMILLMTKKSAVPVYQLKNLTFNLVSDEILIRHHGAAQTEYLFSR